MHDPAIVMSRFDYAYDAVQTQFIQLAGVDTSDIGATMRANEAAIEQTGVVQHSFTAPGTDHTVVGGNEFYETEVNGISLVDWVTDMLAGENVTDVTCTDDGCGGTAAARSAFARSNRDDHLDGRVRRDRSAGAAAVHRRGSRLDRRAGQ
jgi:hypothetical protein